jgi:hypothetical protein
MSKATRVKREKESMERADTRLDLLIEAMKKGETILPDGNEVNTDRIASEITGKYRMLLVNSSGVCFDGPLYADVKRALDSVLESRKLRSN